MLRFADGNKTPRVAPESYTEYCGQAPSATLYIREVPGSNPGRCGFFFRGFPTPSHRGMSHSTDKASAGSVSSSQYLSPFFRTHPHRTHPTSSEGNEKCILSFFFTGITTNPVLIYQCLVKNRQKTIAELSRSGSIRTFLPQQNVTINPHFID
jgi:hypothetical protein